MRDSLRASFHMPDPHSARTETTEFPEKTSMVPYRERFGRKWEGEEFPFGCGVYFIPHNTKQLGISKPSPPVIFGIVVGYTYAPGYMFGKQYKSFSIDDFVGKSLDIDAPTSAFPSFWGKEYIVSRIWLPKGEITYPLKVKYDRMNYTLAGRSDDLFREEAVADKVQNPSQPPPVMPPPSPYNGSTD